MTLAFDDPEGFPGDEPGVAGPYRRTGNDESGNEAAARTTSCAEGADLTLYFFHPVARGPVAFRVSERPWPDIGNPHVRFTAIPIEGAQHRVVRRITPDEPVRRVGMPCALTRTMRKLGLASRTTSRDWGSSGCGRPAP